MFALSPCPFCIHHHHHHHRLVIVSKIIKLAIGGLIPLLSFILFPILYRSLLIAGVSVSWTDRVNVLKYFCTLCYDVSFANCIVNSGIFTLLVELLDEQFRPEFKRYICFAMGILIRHAT